MSQSHSLHKLIMKLIVVFPRHAGFLDCRLTANGTGSRIQALMGHLWSGTVPAYCGVSVDTRVALGDGDAGPHHVERCDPTPTGPNVYEALGLSPHFRVSYLPTSSYVVSQRHSGIHRHPIVHRQGSTPQMSDRSLNP